MGPGLDSGPVLPHTKRVNQREVPPMQFHLRAASDLKTRRLVWVNNEGKIAEAWEWAAICRRMNKGS